MICVSIGRGRHKHVIAEHLHLADQGAQMVELRLDYIQRDISLKRLLESRPCPVVITIRRESDGGRWIKSEEERLTLLRAAIVEGVDYVDIEEDIADKIPRYGKTKRIISLHDFQSTPEDLTAVHARLAKFDGDVIKLATMANSPHDNLRMLRLVRDSNIPTVGICMGEMGTPSRILAGRFGAPFTYATFHHERTLAPGQLSFKQMTSIYHYNDINEETKVFGVIADPIGHSLSPLIHNAAFKHLKMNSVYIPFRVPREDLDTFFKDRNEMGMDGVSVTIPHKESVIRHLTKIDGAVEGIGAGNTIVFRGEEAYGYNTDYHAAMDGIDRVTGAQGNDRPLSGRTALLLGAGGVAKAIAFGLKRRGAKVVIASRTRDRSDQLAQRLGCEACDWQDRHSFSADILVNGTPLGMHPNVDDTPFDAQHLRSDMIVFDTVYNPESTLLIKQARKAGATTITGMEMFVRQAAIQFRHFTNQEAPIDMMRDTVTRAIAAVNY